jgi:hypothetical protein
MSTQARRIALPAPASRALSGEARNLTDSLLCALLGVYLLSLVLEGLLRYALAVGGVPDALYFRDIIPAGTLIFVFLRSLLGENRIEVAIALSAAVLAFHAAYAAILGVPFFSIAFGLKIFMFIPYGIAMWPLIRRRRDSGLTFMSIVFAVTLSGVLANFLVGKMPWEGLEYETSFGAVSTTRTWWIPGGISRLPGFTRTSFNAAMILGITGVLSLVRFRHTAVRLAIAAAALAGIVLTTSKGMILAFPVAAAWLILQAHRPAMRGNTLVAALCATSMALPFLVVYGEVGSAIPSSSFPSLVVSVWDRFTMEWPRAFDLLPDGPGALLGAGPGSIGTPQLYGDDPHRFNAADSLAVFMMINFGLAGLLYYAIPVLGMRMVAAAENPDVYRAYVALLLIAYGYGMSISMMEESFFAIFFGFCFGAVASAFLAPAERRK